MERVDRAACKPSKRRSAASAIPDEQLAALCKAIGHPARIRMLRILIANGTCISGDIAEEFDLAQSTVSEHLRILKDAGLVQGTIDGPRRCYCIDPDVLDSLKAAVIEVTAAASSSAPGRR